MRLSFIATAAPLLFLVSCSSINNHEKAAMQGQLARIDARVEMISRGAKAQAELSTNLGELRNSVMTMTGQVEEFNERARQLTSGMVKMERAFTEMSSVYRSEALERSAATDMTLDRLTGELSQLSLETRAFIKLMEKKNGVTTRAHKSAVDALRKEENRATPPPSTTTMSPGRNVPNHIAPKEPDDLYQDSYNLYLKSEYEAAVSGFTNYLVSYPDTSLSDNAAFWVGESYFAMGQFGKAAIAFDQAAKKYPNSIKAPAALLRAADSYNERNDKEASLTRLRQIIDLYPTSNEAIRASDRLSASDEN